jgi:[citrate (pro-3S)-lyase] ligase
MTNQYNEALLAHLPAKGIEVCQIPRLELEATPISASAVRAHLAAGEWDKLRALVPETTYAYLTEKFSAK